VATLKTRHQRTCATRVSLGTTLTQLKTEVNPLTVYSTYIAIKLHFERGSYDAFKFNFKGPTRKLQNFLKNKDRFTYERIAKKYPVMNDLIGFLLANILAGNTWIRDMDDETYMLWVAKLQRLQYQFSADMNVLLDYAINHSLDFDACLSVRDDRQSVPIIDLVKSARIQVESALIIDHLVGFLARINKSTLSDPLGILSDRVYSMIQYKPFIVSRINTTASKNIIINLFTSVGN
jgi:hypothetical protein